jgi:CBS domain-containing protein
VRSNIVPGAFWVDEEGSTAVKIRDVMTPDIDVLTPEDTLRTAAGLMTELEVDALPVSENDRLIGVITSRDIATQVVTEGGDPKEVRVGQVLSGDVLYCFGNESIADVAQRMAELWAPRLPVVNQDRRPIGIVTLAGLTALKPPPQARQVTHSRQHAHSARQARRARRAVAA